MTGIQAKSDVKKWINFCSTSPLIPALARRAAVVDPPQIETIHPVLQVQRAALSTQDHVQHVAITKKAG
jgi:hypothetical protein